MTTRAYREAAGHWLSAHGWTLAVVLAAVMLSLPLWFPDPSWMRRVTVVCIFSLVTLGLNLSWGYAGELAVGQAAMFAAGAYAAGLVAVHVTAEVFAALPVAVAAAVMLGFMSGIPGLRLGGWALGMVSFFFVLVIPDVLNVFQSLTGGAGGLAAIPQASIAGMSLDSTAYYVLTVAITAVTFAGIRNIVVSRHGDALKVLRQSPVLASSLGIPVYRLKLTAYVLGSVPAGVAGCLFAYLDGYIGPASFGFSSAIMFLASSVLGGATSIYGALLGTALFILGPQGSPALEQYAFLAFGLFLLLGGLVFGDGLTGVLRRGLARMLPGCNSERSVAARAALASLPGEVLSVESLTKQFGGNTALDRVTLSARPGQVTALIGANGSGKTTLLNLVSGFYRPDAGSTIRLGDTDLTKLSTHGIALRGVGRTFQTPAIPRGMTVRRAVASARYERARSSMPAAMLRLPSYRRARREDDELALALLDLVGLAASESNEATSLPLGTRRLLELARALAGGPRVLLLDEPASGLDAADIAEFSAAVRRARDLGATVVLVEHNLPLVLSLADHIYVLSKGRLVAEGAPDDVQRDPAVRETYLGAKAV